MGTLELSVYRITGADRASFLQGQLTQDINQMAGNKALLCGYCNPQGRLLAIPILLEIGPLPDNLSAQPSAEGDWLMLLPKDIAETVVRRLSMFVLRADVQFEPLPCAVFGSRMEHAHPDAHSSWSVQSSDEGLDVALPSVGFLHLSFAADSTSGDHDVARLFIENGIPQVVGTTQEEFIPQTLNMDILNGIHFEKGCYTGQEIIARLHFRGRVKRRMYAFTAKKTVCAPGDEIVNSQGTVVGKVVLAETQNNPETDVEATVLACVRVDEAHDLRTTDGTALTAAALPYTISDS